MRPIKNLTRGYYWLKNRQIDQWNIKESPITDSHFYSHKIYSKSAVAVQWEKNVLFKKIFLNQLNICMRVGRWIFIHSWATIYFLSYLFFFFFFSINWVFFITQFFSSNSFLVIHSFINPWVIQGSWVKAWGIYQDPAILAGIEGLDQKFLLTFLGSQMLLLGFLVCPPAHDKCRNSKCPQEETTQTIGLPCLQFSLLSDLGPPVPPYLFFPA